MGKSAEEIQQDLIARKRRELASADETIANPRNDLERAQATEARRQILEQLQRYIDGDF